MTLSRRETLIGLGTLAATSTVVLAKSPSDRASDRVTQTQQADRLRHVLGDMPERPRPQFTILETATVGTGTRYKVEYLAEE